MGRVPLRESSSWNAFLWSWIVNWTLRKTAWLEASRLIPCCLEAAEAVMAGQPGFFDADERLKALSVAGDPLEAAATSPSRIIVRT